MSELLRERQGHIEILTINRPEARNAINGPVSLAFAAAFDELEADDDCWVVIVTGAGDKAFSAGMDLKAFAAGEAGDIMGANGGFGGIAQRDFPKPIIAAVNGSALAGGCEIMLSCDLVVAVEEAKFGIPEVKRGLMAAAGALIRLPKRIPPTIAMELALTGDPIDAQRALALGLINRVVPADRLMEEALALAGHHRRQRPPGHPGLEAGAEAGRRAPRRRGMGHQQRRRARGVRFGRRHGGPDRLRREAQAQLVGQIAGPVGSGGSVLPGGGPCCPMSHLALVSRAPWRHHPGGRRHRIPR